MFFAGVWNLQTKIPWFLKTFRFFVVFTNIPSHFVKKSNIPSLMQPSVSEKFSNNFVNFDPNQLSDPTKNWIPSDTMLLKTFCGNCLRSGEVNSASTHKRTRNDEEKKKQPVLFWKEGGHIYPGPNGKAGKSSISNTYQLERGYDGYVSFEEGMSKKRIDFWNSSLYKLKNAYHENIDGMAL